MTDSSAGGVPPDQADELAGQQARARSTRQALLLAAADRFAAEGYHGTSLNDVLVASGLTKGALYFHFRSKRALADALMEEMLAGWQRWLSSVEPGDADPLWTLLSQTDQVVARLIYDPVVRAATRLLRDEAVSSPATVSYASQWQEAMRRLLTQAADRGLLRDGVSPAWVAGLTVAAVVGHTVIAETVSTGEDLWRRVTGYWAGVLPLIATDSWLRSWRDAGRLERPKPS